MKMTPQKVAEVFPRVMRGMARLQARQEMMECVVRALIAESPPAHPLFWKALHTAKSDLAQRTARTRAEHPPEIDADAMALWNELCSACVPPVDPGK